MRRTRDRALRTVAVVAAFGIACAWAATAEAQLEIDNVPDTLIEAFRSHLARWSLVLWAYAKKLFFALAAIELTISWLRAYYQEGGTFDRIGAAFIERALFIGFWATLLSYGPEAMHNLVQTFKDLGAQATGQALTPTAILEQGLGITLDLMSLAYEEGVLQSATLFFPLTILALVFVFATAEVVGALIDGYVIASAGIVMLGFGGSRWTSGIAQNYLRISLGAGVHLLVVNLVAAVGMSALLEIAAVIKGIGDEGLPGLIAVILYVLGAAILFAYLLRRVPTMAAAIATGAVSADSGSAVIAAAASGAHMGATAAMMTVAPAGRAMGALAATASAALGQRGHATPAELESLAQAGAAAAPVAPSFGSPHPSAAIKKGQRDG